MRATLGITGENRRVLLAGGAIAAAALVAYHGSFSTPFVFDDIAVIADNPTIRHLWPLGDVLSPPAGGQTVSGRPILNLSYALNYAATGTSVAGFHWANLVIHILCGWLLFGIAKGALERRGNLPSVPLAFSVALLWTVHPLQTESVTYLAQRAESLAAFFFLLTLYASIRSTQPRNRRVWSAVSIGACALAMATKETSVSAPVIVFAFDSIFISSGWRDALTKRWGLYLALVLTWIIPVWLSGPVLGRGATAGFGSGVTVWAYALTQCRAIARYLALSIWPRPLVFDYGTSLAKSFAAIAPGVVLITLLAAATVVALRRRSPGGFLGLWFFATLAPSSSFVPVATQTEAEHRMYLPLAAVIALIASAGYTALKGLQDPTDRVRGDEAGSLGNPRGRSTTGLFLSISLAAAAALTAATQARNRDYRTEATLWQDTVEKRPTNARAHCNLGTALLQERRYDAAIAEFGTALKLQPGYALAELNWGNALLRQDRLPEALVHYAAAVHDDPGSSDAHSNYGSLLLKLHRYDEAQREFRQAIQIAPAADSFANLASALSRSGKLEEFLPFYREALRFDANDAEIHYNYGNALAHLGRPGEAAAQYEAALRTEPGMNDARTNLDLVRAQQKDGPP